MLGGAVDIGGGLLISVVLWRLGMLEWDRWYAADEGLLWIEATSLRFYRDPGPFFVDLLVAWVPVMLWHAVLGGLFGRTPGMRVAGLEAVEASGQRADALRMLGRGLWYVLWPLSLFLVVLWIPASRSQRGLHDLLARTWIVKART